jgi:flagellar protein FlaG
MAISSITSVVPDAANATRDPVVRTEVPGSATNKTQEASAPQTRPPEESRRGEQPSDATAREAAEMRELVELANERLKSSNAVIAFNVDPDTKMVVTTLLDSRTNEVIRQIPTEAVLEIARSLDKIAPVLVQEKV